MNIKTYREKKNEVHTPEEIQAAFDGSYAVCFDLNHENVEEGHKKRKLFGDIWSLNPDAIITEADLCVMNIEPVVLRDQFLLINKNGTKESSNEIARLMAESGIIQYEYRFISEKRAGIRRCYGNITADPKTSVIPYKGNLLIDGDKILLTARHMTKADREALKAWNTENEEE